MTLQEEVVQLAEIVPREPDTELPPGATDSRIDGFVARRGVRIPPEVRDWLRFTDGPAIGQGGVFGLDDFDETYGALPGFQERNWLPLGTDGCGGYYVLALAAREQPLRPVYYIDPHSSGFDEPTYAVASNFWRFLWFLFRSELGEKDWPFNEAVVLAADPELASVKSAPLPWNAD